MDCQDEERMIINVYLDNEDSFAIKYMTNNLETFKIGKSMATFSHHDLIINIAHSSF